MAVVAYSVYQGRVENVISAPRPVHCAPRRSGPLLLTLGGLEGVEYHRQSETLAATWHSRKLPCQVVPMGKHDHFSIVAELEDSSSTLSRLLLRQMGLR